MIKFLISIGIVGLIFFNENVNSSISSTKQFHVATKQELKRKKSKLDSMGDEYIVKDGVPLHITLYRLNDELMEKTKSLREQLDLCLNDESLNVDTMDEGILFGSQINNNNDEINHLQHKLHQAKQKIQDIHEYLGDGDTSTYIIHLETQNKHLRDLSNQQKRENEGLQSQIKNIMSNTAAISPASFQYQLMQCNEKVITLENDRKQCREDHYNSELTLGHCRNTMNNLQRQLMHQPAHQTIINPLGSTINQLQSQQGINPHLHHIESVHIGGSNDDCTQYMAPLHQKIHDSLLQINQLQLQHDQNIKHLKQELMQRDQTITGLRGQIFHKHPGQTIITSSGSPLNPQHTTPVHITGVEGHTTDIIQNDCSTFTAPFKQQIHELHSQINQLQSQYDINIQTAIRSRDERIALLQTQLTDHSGLQQQKLADCIRTQQEMQLKMLQQSISPLPPLQTMVHTTTPSDPCDCSLIIQQATHDKDAAIAHLQSQSTDQQQQIAEYRRIQQEMQLKLLQQSIPPLPPLQAMVGSTSPAVPCDYSSIIQQTTQQIQAREAEWKRIYAQNEQQCQRDIAQLNEQIDTLTMKLSSQPLVNQHAATFIDCHTQITEALHPLQQQNAALTAQLSQISGHPQIITRDCAREIETAITELRLIQPPTSLNYDGLKLFYQQQIDELMRRLAQQSIGQHTTTTINCHAQITEALRPLQQQNAALTAQLSQISGNPQIITRDCVREIETAITELGLIQPPTSLNYDGLKLFYQQQIDELMRRLAQQSMGQHTTTTINCHAQIIEALRPLQQQNAALIAQLSGVPVTSQITPIDCVREIETAITQLRLQQPPASVNCDELKIFYQRQIAELEAQIHSLGQTGYVGGAVSRPPQGAQPIYMQPGMEQYNIQHVVYEDNAYRPPQGAKPMYIPPGMEQQNIQHVIYENNAPPQPGYVIHQTVEGDTSTQPGITHIVYPDGSAPPGGHRKETFYPPGGRQGHIIDERVYPEDGGYQTFTNPGYIGSQTPPLQTHYHTTEIIEHAAGGGDKQNVPERLERVIETREYVPIQPGERSPSDVGPDIIHETVTADCTEEVRRATDELRSYYERILQEQRDNPQYGEVKKEVVEIASDCHDEIEQIRILKEEECQSKLIKLQQDCNSYWIERIKSGEGIDEIISRPPPHPQQHIVDTVTIHDDNDCEQLQERNRDLVQIIERLTQEHVPPGSYPRPPGYKIDPDEIREIETIIEDCNNFWKHIIEQIQIEHPGDIIYDTVEPDLPPPDTPIAVAERPKLKTEFSASNTRQEQSKSPTQELQSASSHSASPRIEHQPPDTPIRPVLETASGGTTQASRINVGKQPPKRVSGGEGGDIASPDEEEDNAEDECREYDKYIYIDIIKLYPSHFIFD